MSELLIKELLMSSGYWVLNKSVVKEIGLEPAFILTNMVEAESMMADDEGWFYQTADTLKELTGMSSYKQTKAINELINFGILEQKNIGVPMKRYFKINYDSIQKLVFKKFKNCNSKNLKTSIQKIEKNKESIINNIDKKNIITTQSVSKYSEFYKYLSNKLVVNIAHIELILKPMAIKDIDLGKVIEEINNSEWLGSMRGMTKFRKYFSTRQQLEKIASGYYQDDKESYSECDLDKITAELEEKYNVQKLL